MEPFVCHTGVVAALDRSNVDTDAIIPKQFLKSIRRTGFDAGLFYDWRFRPDGSPDPGFPLNHPAFSNASILLTRHNFGCGSSREHAVWAVRQYGFRVVLAPWMAEGQNRVPAFADIFYNNSVKNGLLCVSLEPAEIEACFQAVAATPGVSATVDLQACTVRLPADGERVFRFTIEAQVRETLLRGLDDIARTLAVEADIKAFEARHQPYLEST